MQCLRRSLASRARGVLSSGRRWGSSGSVDANAATGEEGGGGDEGARGEGEEAWPRVVVSGLQPTGALHVGNYFGALRQCVRAQDRGDDLVLFVADLHALTTTQDARALSENTLETAALALAAGVDPARAVLFAQSAVPRHAELCWLLACLCTQARLHHLPQYKEKAARVAGGAGAVPLGLLMYPVLQAADVLVYRGTRVPAGADQRQHVQLAALLARSFRHRFGPAFPVPRAWLPEDGGDRILSLRDPARKMSKSDRDARAALLLRDSDADIRRKVRKAVTDCEPRVAFEPGARPGVANLVRLHCLAAGLTPEEAVEENSHLTTAQYKSVVAAALVAALGPVRARAAELRRREGALRAVLRAGAVRARRRADATYAAAAALAGLAPFHLPAPPPARLRIDPVPATTTTSAAAPAAAAAAS